MTVPKIQRTCQHHTKHFHIGTRHIQPRSYSLPLSHSHTNTIFANVLAQLAPAQRQDTVAARLLSFLASKFQGLWLLRDAGSHVRDLLM